ncbi:MAG: VCBS repeat-containing protein, partial [Planctomycetaceae bacterium]|nr:VCBS repeat-containing protein [Planctomycetaceae bacterium]
DSATFTITGVSDNFVDGTETVTITASKSGFTNGFDTVNVINVDVPAIILSIDLASISENGGIATGTVTRNTDTTSPLTVTLMSSDTGEATVPMSVDILAGNASATFPITGVHDNIVDGTQTVTVTGSAAMLADGTDTVDIADIDVPTLTLTIDLASISEDGGTATGTVTRNTDTTNALTVMLISSDTGEAIVPMSVDIPAGKASATFPITGVNDNFVDGTETITITASAATFIDGTDTVDVTNVDVPTLTVTIDKGVISEGGDTATGTVSRNTDTTASLTVTLTSSDTGEAMVPMSVEIPAGKVSATFAITGVNDFFVDGVQTVIITASASDHLNGSETIDVADVDVPMLTLSINEDAISEDGGTATGNILRNTFPSNSLMVTLMSSDTGEASVPLFVEIPAGKTSAAFTITGVSDFFIDGTQTVTITASALSFADGTDTLDITDVSVPALMVTLDKSLISENGGMATGTVTRSTSTASTLTVTLASSDLTEASVPMTVVIPTGQASVTFPVAAVDDSFDDGDRSSVITASALGHDSGEASILIIDDDNSSAPDDILLFDETSGTFKLGTNTGTGFVWAQTGGLPSDAEFIGDFDGDGDLDAAYFNATTLNTNLVRNNGDGTFALPSLRGTISKGAPLDSFIGVADLEGDGTEEILYLRQHPVITENVQIWSKSLLPGGAEDFKISVAGGYTDFVIGDFNGDGRDDVVGLRPNLAGTQVNIIPLYSVNNGGNLSVLLSSGQFGTSQVFSPQAADLNHDGRDDLVVQRADGQVIHATSTGNSRPAIAGAHNFVATLRAPSLPEPSYPSGLLLGRFSDDTLVDLVAVDANGDILFAGTTLNPSFLNPVVISNSLDTWGTGPIGERYVVGDFNGDGYDDLAALGTNATIFFSSGDGSQFGAPLNFGPIIGGGAGQIVTVKTG